MWSGKSTCDGCTYDRVGAHETGVTYCNEIVDNIEMTPEKASKLIALGDELQEEIDSYLLKTINKG